MGSSRAAVGAAFTLWYTSFHQVPAGTLPNSDRLLRRMACCTDREWRAVRQVCMHGFRLCSDGRYHHEVLAEVVLDAWKKKHHGKKAARARWDASAHADAMHMHSMGNANEREREKEMTLERIRAPTGSDSLSVKDAGTEPPVGAVPTRLPTMEERQESREELIARQQEELRARNGHTKADEIAAIKAVTDPAAVDDETGAGRTAEGARGEGEDGQASPAEPELELPAGGGGDAEGL